MRLRYSDSDGDFITLAYTPTHPPFRPYVLQIWSRKPSVSEALKPAEWSRVPTLFDHYAVCEVKFVFGAEKSLVW